ncbi:MAG: hypothetical protein KDJ29_15760 [Hyphomicrobiales bacterium]|nr:hypothetical protein [Hyphomicrobiales bacterium]
MGKIFIGPARYWAILIIVTASAWYMGRIQFHISHYRLFVPALLLLSFAAVALVAFTYRRTERITREPLDGGDQA